MLRAARPVARLAPRSLRVSPAFQHPPSLRASPAIIPQMVLPPLSNQTWRHLATSKRSDPPPPKQPIDHEAERKAGQQKIRPRPDEVSAESSTQQVFGSGPGQGSGSPVSDDVNMTEGLKHDLGVVRDTFRLSSVPRGSHILGLAGTIPYLATSISTVYLAWDLSKELPTSSSFYNSILISHDTARYLLSVIEPVQLGYGAVIISFLGAIHWGLEYAEKKPLPERTRFRYGMGLAASIVAWPTLFMPVEYALTTQFMAFVALYFADSRAASRGWAPYWYGTYRFLLTAMVGLAILVSLVGRAKIGEADRLDTRLRQNMESPGIADRDTDWAKLEKEEKKRIKKEKQAAERKAKQEAKAKEQEEAKAKANGGNAAATSGDSDKSKDDNDDSQQDQSEESEDKEKESSGKGDAEVSGKEPSKSGDGSKDGKK